MMELNNIIVRYGDRVVVDAVTAQADAGQLIALVGPNGSGKSSLLKAITELIPHEGTTNLPQTSRAKSLAYLAQDATAPDARRVRDIIALGRTPHIGALGRMTEADHAAVTRALETCQLTDFADRRFGDLSGGEQTRVHLARALATEAPRLLADEPVTALDPYYQLSVMGVLRSSANTGTTVIAALHDLDLARRFADRIWVMQAGRKVADLPGGAPIPDSVLADVFRVRMTTQGLEPTR